MSGPKPRDNPTDTSIQVLLYESLTLRANVIQLINNRHRQSYHEVLNLGGELRNVCRKVVSFFNSNIPCQSVHGLRYTNFRRLFFDIQLRRCILFLYTPFIIQARLEPQFHYAWKACLESAVVIASYANKGLVRPCDGGRRMRSCRTDSTHLWRVCREYDRTGRTDIRSGKESSMGLAAVSRMSC